MTSAATLMANNVINTCGITDPAQVSLEDLIIYHNGWVQDKPLTACDGRTVMKNGRAIVSVDSMIAYPPKRRFVLAHELGHMLLHPGKEVGFEDDYSTLEAYKKGPQEIEANDFAASLLMPEGLFRKTCFKVKFTPALITTLAEKFNTTLTAAAYRYVTHGNHPICAFYSKDRVLQYWKRSDDFRFYIPDTTRLAIPSDSVANEYYTHGRIYSGSNAIQTITQSTWFALRSYETDQRMYEYCIVTPKYNTVLSVVWA